MKMRGRKCSRAFLTNFLQPCLTSFFPLTLIYNEYFDWGVIIWLCNVYEDCAFGLWVAYVLSCNITLGSETQIYKLGLLIKSHTKEL